MHCLGWNKKFLLILILAENLVMTRLFAQESLVGRWIAADDADKGVTSVVEFYQQDAKVHGRIFLTRDAKGQEIHPVCELCTGSLRGAPLKGMTFISGLVQQQQSWVGGQVIDLRPGLTQGLTASCEISLVNGRAIVLGYFMTRAWGQSRTWIRL
jgi:hypothetical protein